MSNEPSASVPVTWESPGDGPVNEKHPEFWSALHAHPDEWAIWPGPSRNTTQINRRKRDGGKYQAVQRNNKMYVRWIAD